MRTTIAVILNVIISIIYLLGICLTNRLVPIAHPNVAYGLTMIAWTSILFVIQLLLLLLLLFFGKNKFNLGAPDKPCGVGRADANPKLLLNDT